jgi:hypothetical protein
MEPSTWGYSRATLFLENKIRGSGSPGWRNFDSETAKCGHESRGTLDMRMTALERTSNNCKRQTQPFIREDVTQGL